MTERNGFNPNVKVGPDGEAQFVDNDEPALPDMELNNMVERMTMAERVQEKRRLLSEISDREALVHLINDVNAAEGKDNVDIIY